MLFSANFPLRRRGMLDHTKFLVYDRSPSIHSLKIFLIHCHRFKNGNFKDHLGKKPNPSFPLEEADYGRQGLVNSLLH